MAGLERARRCRWADVGRSAHPEAALAGRRGRAQRAGRPRRRALAPRLRLRRLRLARARRRGQPRSPATRPSPAARRPARSTLPAPATDSVVVLALGGEGFSFSMAAVSAAVDPRDAGARAAACVGDIADREHRVLLLLTDGTSARQPEIVRGAYSVAGAGVPLVGGMRRPAPPRRAALADLRRRGPARCRRRRRDRLRRAAGRRRPPRLAPRRRADARHARRARPRAGARRPPGGRGLPRAARRPSSPSTVTLAHPLGMRRRVGEAACALGRRRRLRRTAR